MSDWVIALVPTYGLWLMAVVTFLSCLALPVPCSLVMLTAGGFAAAGDLVLWQVAAAALVGAVMGDQTGYGIGRKGGAPLLSRMGSDPAPVPSMVTRKERMKPRSVMPLPAVMTA